MASILKTSHSTYRVRYRDPSGKDRSRTFKKLALARTFMNGVETDKTRGDWVDPGVTRIPLDAWMKQWFDFCQVSPRTRKGYDQKWRLYISPALGSLPIGAVDRAAVKGMVAGMMEKGYAPATIRQTCAVLRQVLDMAVEGGGLKSNPALRLKLASPSPDEMHFLTVEQILALADAITHPPIAQGGGEHRRGAYEEYGALVLFTAYTGLRAGEVASLRVKRLDLNACKVTVASDLAKSGKARTITFPQSLVRDMKVVVDGRGGDEMVFRSATGSKFDHNNFYNRHFKPAAARIGVAELRFHDLRHTNAALLISLGAHPRAIMERLGHSSITVTLGTYGHLFPGVDEQLGEGLGRLFE